jgi:hypothetical protein
MVGIGDLGDRAVIDDLSGTNFGDDKTWWHCLFPNGARRDTESDYAGERETKPERASPEREQRHDMSSTRPNPDLHQRVGRLDAGHCGVAARPHELSAGAGDTASSPQKRKRPVTNEGARP